MKQANSCRRQPKTSATVGGLRFERPRIPRLDAWVSTHSRIAGLNHAAGASNRNLPAYIIGSRKLAANSNKAPRMPRILGEKYSTSVSLAKPFTEWWLR